MPQLEEPIDNIDSIINHLIVKPGQEATGDGEDDTTGEDTSQEQREEPVVKAAKEETPREVKEPDDQQQDEPVSEPPVDDEDNIDVDSIELEVTVDGELRRVPIAELKKRYSAEGAIEKRLQEATEGRNYLMRQSEELNSVLATSVAKLRALDGVLEQAQIPQVDMETLRKTDPTKWLFEKERQREIQDRRNRIAYEAEQMELQQQRLSQAALVEHTRSEFKKIAKAYPEFADPKTAKTERDSLYETAKYYNYSPQEVDSVRDHRALLVLRDAKLWRQHLAKQAKTGEARSEPRPLLKPGAKKTSTATREQRELRALRDKARQTGRPDDVAATLIMRSRGPR